MNFALMVFGPHIDYIDTVCFRSLFQSENIPKLLKEGVAITFFIYTEKSDVERLIGLVDKWKIDGIVFKVFGLKRAALHHKLFQDCAGSDKPMFFVSPDFFFSNGSIYNMASIKYKGAMCIAAAHVRVETEPFLRLLKEDAGEISSARLVSIAMKMPHQSLSGAFIDKDCNGSRHGGFAIQRIGNENLWAMTHRLPTPFIVNMQADDLPFLKIFGAYDHSWPSKLIKEKRYKYVGSSDVFFAVELTQADMNSVNMLPDSLWNDESDQRDKHNEVNRNFLPILRGENAPC
jgi:hypothetical protein